MRRLILILICVLLVPTAKARLGEPHVSLPMQSFADCASPRAITFDVLQPAAGQPPYPALLMVHGGGWSAGSRSDYHASMRDLTRLGIVTVSVDYRLAPGAAFPAQIEDVKCATRWLRAHATQFQVDQNKIAALGGSAGGHLVGLLGTTPGKWEGSGGYQEQSSAISCMILHGAPSDFSTGWLDADASTARGREARNMLQALLHADFVSQPALYREASPSSYISRLTPPSLLIHGALDDLVPLSQSQRFAAKLAAYGVAVDLLIIPDGDHAGFGTQSQRVSERFLGFLKLCLD